MNSFIAHYSIIFNMIARSIQYKVLIGEAIRNDVFTQKTIYLLIQGKIISLSMNNSLIGCNNS